MTVHGYDISHHQTSVPNLADFLWLKATEGSGYTDATYKDRHAAVRNAGKVCGAYHFFHPGEDIGTQVRHFLAVAQLQPGDIWALDFEDDGTWRHHSNRDLAAAGTAFMRAALTAAPRNRGLLYANRSAYWSIVHPFNLPVGDGLWIASPGRTPDMPWTFWQDGWKPIDSDVGAFKSATDLHTWARGKEHDMQLTDEYEDSYGNKQTVKSTYDNIDRRTVNILDAVQDLTKIVEALWSNQISNPRYDPKNTNSGDIRSHKSYMASDLLAGANLKADDANVKLDDTNVKLDDIKSTLAKMTNTAKPASP